MASDRSEPARDHTHRMRITPLLVRPLTAALAAALTLAVLAPMAPRPDSGPVKVRAAETTEAVNGTRDFEIATDATHVAIHWAGHPDAVVTASFSKDGNAFSKPTPVEIDDGDEGPDVATTDETYGTLLEVDGVRTVRVHTDRPLARVSVLALDAAGPQPPPLGMGAVADGGTTIPWIISRSQWGADETLRFDPAGDEFWPREFFPAQKLVVHHTAGSNNDPNPAATVRAIYYYHAVTRRWFDIGYNYLIDAQGRIYEGRYARDFWNGELPSSDNTSGLSVAGGHARYYNQGTIGISLMGNFTSQAPTAAAHASLVKLLAWAAAKYHIDPHGASTYVNPNTGVTITTNNIGGHRDYQATSCPGTMVYAQLPQIRNEVAAQINAWPAEIYNPTRNLSFAAGAYVGRMFSASGAVTATKSATLPAPSMAPTDQKAVVPNQSGSWYHVTSGIWAGYWIAASPGVTVSGLRARPLVETFETARPVTLPGGSYNAHKFDTWGNVKASKSATVPTGTVVWATQRSTIPKQTGRWYFVTVGTWAGWWLAETSGMTLGAPAPPLPTPIAIYNPPRTLWFAPGTYVGRRFSQYGVPDGTWTHTLTKASSAPTSRYSTLPGQTGKWYYIVLGVWDTYWIKESAGTTFTKP